jgi:hypothetical protein
VLATAQQGASTDRKRQEDRQHGSESPSPEEEPRRTQRRDYHRRTDRPWQSIWAHAPTESAYKGVTIQTTGYVTNISQDILGSYYVALNPTDDPSYVGRSPQCFGSDTSQLTPLSNGQKVTVRAKRDAEQGTRPPRSGALFVCSVNPW